MPQSITADLILTNGRVYSDHFTGRRWSEAISIREGNILSMGEKKAIEKERGPSTRVIDLKGRVVLPGFNDAQVHLLEGGLSLSQLDLRGVRSVAELQDRLKMFAATHPSKPWLLGFGWDNATLPKQKFPTKEDLDAAIANRPVALFHADGRALLVNTKGLEQLGVKATTTDHNYHRNEKGELSGVLFEEAALEARRKAESPSADELKQAWLSAQTETAANGITSIQGGPLRGEEELRIVQELYNAKQLKLRYAVWGRLEAPEELLSLKEKYKQIPEEWLRFDAVKGFVDGAIATRTAALHEPYSDLPGRTGEPLLTQERLNELVLGANRLGLPVVLHATGDRAVAMAVNAFANARHKLFNSRIRNRIDHVEVVPQEVYQRISDAGLVVTAYPSHLAEEPESLGTLEKRIGPQRSRHAFAWRSFFSAKVHLAFGSAWPAMPLDPMQGLFAAVYRQYVDGKPYRGWLPAQRLTLDQAIDAYTAGSAYATREEHVKGTLREGKYADLVVLERDPFKARGKELLKIKPAMTILGGQVVFETPGPTPKPSPSQN